MGVMSIRCVALLAVIVFATSDEQRHAQPVSVCKDDALMQVQVRVGIADDEAMVQVLSTVVKSVVNTSADCNDEGEACDEERSSSADVVSIAAEHSLPEAQANVPNVTDVVIEVVDKWQRLRRDMAPMFLQGLRNVHQLYLEKSSQSVALTTVLLMLFVLAAFAVAVLLVMIFQRYYKTTEADSPGFGRSPGRAERRPMRSESLTRKNALPVHSPPSAPPPHSSAPLPSNPSTHQKFPQPPPEPVPSRTTVSEISPLCDDLRVPDGSQCVLAVPSLVDAGTSLHDLQIVDRAGEPLMCISLRRQGDVEVVVLMGWRGRNELATSKMYFSEGVARIFRPSGELYAILCPTSPNSVTDLVNSAPGDMIFKLSAANGQPMILIKGDPRSRQLLLTSEEGRIVAAVNPGDSSSTIEKNNANNLHYNQMRVAPGTDASVIIFACLAVDRFPRAARSVRSSLHSSTGHL